MLKKLPFGKIILTLIALSYIIRWAFYDNQLLKTDIQLNPYVPNANATYDSQLLKTDIQLNPYIPNANATVFAAYSADGSVPDYVVDYVKKLKEITPNIIYVTDNPIQRDAAKKLTPYITHLTAYKHGEYDFGSYKRGFSTLKKYGSFNKLILANDSMFPLADSFQPIMADMDKKQADFYGITSNTQVHPHLQSYFIAFTPKVWQHPAFTHFLNTVKPQPDGWHVTINYEIPLTQYLINLGFKADTYIAMEKLEHLPMPNKTFYPLTLISQHNAPLLKVRTFTPNGLNIQESRRLVFNWLKKNKPQAYMLIIKHLEHINSPYLKDNR